MSITSSEYRAELKYLAASLLDENKEEASERGDSVLEFIMDNGLDHETVDGHQWMIYYSYSLDIIKHSSNEDYMVDNLGDESLGHALKNGGLNGLHQAIAFYAMLADLNEALYELEKESEA